MIDSATNSPTCHDRVLGQMQRFGRCARQWVVAQAWDGGDARQAHTCEPIFPARKGKFPGATLVQPSSGWFLKLA